MRRSGRLTAAALIVIAVVGGAVLAGGGDEGGPSAPPGAVSSESSLGPLPEGARGCRYRTEGGRLEALRGRDTTVGPVSFLAARSNYVSAARLEHSSRGAENLYPGFPGHALKVIALVDAGRQVTLRVPREQRRWMRLAYDVQGGLRTAVTLRACRRSATSEAQERECGRRPFVACKWRNTQFTGGFVVDLDSAPLRGRCAELWVDVAGERGTRRAHLFEPRPERCARTVELSDRPRLPPGSIEFNDRRHDLRVTLPATWHRARETIMPRQAKPADILAVGSFRPRAEPGATCTSAPDSPQLRVGAEDALVVVHQERNPQATSGPGRPARYRLLKQVRRVGRGGPNRQPGQVLPWTCLNRVGISGVRASFSADRRFFYVTAIVGERSTPALRQQTLGVLDSIEFGAE